LTKIIRNNPMQRNSVSPRSPMRWLCEARVAQLTKPVARNVVHVPDSE